MLSNYPINIAYNRENNRILYTSKGYHGEYTIGQKYTVWNGVLQHFIKKRKPCFYS